MLTVGLTGGLACGKSTVARLLQQRGFHVLQADLLAHQIMQPGGQIYEQVVQAFGADILIGAPGSPIDRSRLAAKAFAQNASRLPELNALVHPAVIVAQDEWMRGIALTDPSGIAVVEAALIFEAHSESQFDKMIVVVAPEDRKIERYAERVLSALEQIEGPLDPTTRAKLLPDARAEAERRIAAQIPDEVKRSKADFVIENAGTLAELDTQVANIAASLRALAGGTQAEDAHATGVRGENAEGPPKSS